eukprot:2731508-Amphidinium_carterae.1
MIAALGPWEFAVLCRRLPHPEQAPRLLGGPQVVLIDFGGASGQATHIACRSLSCSSFKLSLTDHTH